jgi:hypothetical protein
MQKNMRKGKATRRTNDRNTDDQKLAKQRLDQELDSQLEATFPASDALKITLRHSDRPVKLTRRARTTR